MKIVNPRLRRRARMGATGAAVLLAAACGGGGDASADEAEADVAKAVENVDADASATVTEQELSSFRAPADSVLTPQQIEAYLKTSLVQFDLIRREAPRLHEKAKQIEARGEKADGGVLSGLRNAAEGFGLIAQYGDIVGGSFVRSSRSLGYNPAELEWVRERVGEVSGYLTVKPILEGSLKSAQQLKEQAESYRGQPGWTDEQVDAMIQQADEMAKNAAEQQSVSRAVQRNYEVLRQYRGNVTDPMWSVVGFAGGTAGLFALSGLADPNDSTAQKELDKFRRVYTDVLDNKVTPDLAANGQQAEQQ